MLSETNIRKAAYDDVEDVQQVYAKSWAEAYTGVIEEEALRQATSEPAQFYPEKKIRAQLENEDSLYLVAETSNGIIGMSYFAWGEKRTHPFVDSGSAQLRAIYVDPAHWGEGAGRALLEAGLDRLPATPDEVVIECITGNERARAFYESQGFEQYGDRSIECFDGEEHRTTLYRRPLR